MQFIKHRVNCSSELFSLDLDWGVEIDLRSNVQQPGAVHLSHDPWVLGEDFDGWARAFAARGCRGPLILNTKEDALEDRILQILKAHNLSNYFFLDTQLPTLVKRTIEFGEQAFAVRLSRYEPSLLCDVFAGKAAWIWVDCFGGVPVAAADVATLRQRFKVCLVSPELQGASFDTLPRFRELSAVADAICTKQPGRWQTMLANS